MALDGTYTGLQASVADFLNRSDLTAAVKDFIALAEAQMNRRLQAREMQRFLPILISAVNCPMPPGLLNVISLQLQDNCVRKLTYITNEEFDRREIGETGLPREYTVVGNEFLFWPTPQQPTTVNLRYRTRIDPLSLACPSNWVLQKHPDAYLYGALVQSAPYLKDDARIQVWGDLFNAALNDIEAADRRTVADSLEMRSGIEDGPLRLYPPYIYGAYNP